MSGQIHGAISGIAQTGSTANNIAQSIDGHKQRAMSQADALSGAWEGQAKVSFDQAFANWVTGVQRVVASLTELGENVTFASRTYEQQDQDSAGGFAGLTTH
ncbi:MULTISPECIES: WXG100 family type VII secretion target [unclassified Crossiella]|uniref:WXG100 family type VII secretion target n=1 Tax=unclassified Crossiella TaxID=2620835 RepID=UPI00207C3187|nr:MULTISPECIES: WXG100 family type VII secretion target [unclassified Crossiella]MCO1582064.1 WXG100 family type VII secretion target [Crossiella sp. SN42]WHT18016.1 WXG100 family type VII secretion target [Crossiella sp. CA-258035]